MKLNWRTNGTAKPFYLRRAFELKEKPAEAVLYASGLGQFNAWINGSSVGDHYLDPAWTDYNKQVSM